MGRQRLVWVFCSVLCAICGAGEPVSSAVLAKLQAERIAPVKLEDASPRTVAAFLHGRLAAHAGREGYELVWDVPENLPDTPQVLFGVENGTLALLMEAATRFAGLTVVATDQELTIHARVLDEALRETRRYPVCEEFRQSISPRSPEEFFQELGIEFPKGTSARLSPDHRELTVTHNPETLALIEEILRVTFAYPCHWQLRLSLIDSSGHETPFAEPLVLVHKTMARTHHEGPEAGEVVTVSAQEEEESRKERVVRFALETQMERQGRMVRRESTALVLADGIGTVLDLGQGEQLRVVAGFRAADGTPYPSAPPDAPEPPPLSAETQRQLEIILPRFEADEEPADSVLRRIAAASREHDPQSRGIGIAYVFEPECLDDDQPDPPAANEGFAPVVNLNMENIPAQELLRYLALGLEMNRTPVDQGVAILSEGVAGIPLGHMVIGPGAMADYLITRDPGAKESLWGVDGEEAPDPGASRRIQTFLERLGVGFTARAHIDCAEYATSWVIIVTNSQQNTRTLQQLMQTIDGWRVCCRLWHTEVRLVRLPATVPGNELEASLAAAAQGNVGPLLAQVAATVFVAQTTSFDGGTAVCRLPGTGQREDAITLTTCTRSGLEHDDKANVEVTITGRHGRRNWHSELEVKPHEWPDKVCQVIGADSIDPGRAEGERSFLLLLHVAEPSCVGVAP